jgi:hypothetical protein
LLAVAGRAATFVILTGAFFLGVSAFFLGTLFVGAGFRATTGRAAFARCALRAAALLAVAGVWERVEAARFRASFLRTALTRTCFRAVFLTAFCRTLRTGRALRDRPAPRAALVAFRAVARALLRLAIV